MDPEMYILFSSQVALDITFEKLCQLTWGEKVIVMIRDDCVDLKQQHREGYFVCNLTRSAQDFPTVLFLQM